MWEKMYILESMKSSKVTQLNFPNTFYSNINVYEWSQVSEGGNNFNFL